MEQVMKSLEDLELRERLALELKDEADEQEAFEKRLRAQESIPVMSKFERKLTKPMRNPVLQQAVRRACRRGR